MDTELLETFLEVRKTRHFGRAAENLYITQAAVSARLMPHAETMLLALARARQDVVLHVESLEPDSLTRPLEH